MTGMTAPMVLNGAMNGIAFRAYVEQVPVPTLAQSDIVVMDSRRRPVAPKTPAHKTEGVRLAIEKTGAQMRYP
jgi:hypothetical protein